MSNRPNHCTNKPKAKPSRPFTLPPAEATPELLALVAEGRLRPSGEVGRLHGQIVERYVLTPLGRAFGDVDPERGSVVALVAQLIDEGTIVATGDKRLDRSGLLQPVYRAVDPTDQRHG
jgi:hypothetical protein